jgi:hypothetical protein
MSPTRGVSASAGLDGPIREFFGRTVNTYALLVDAVTVGTLTYVMYLFTLRLVVWIFPVQLLTITG